MCEGEFQFKTNPQKYFQLKQSTLNDMCQIGVGPLQFQPKTKYNQPFITSLETLNQFANHSSNEKVHETKVVDLEKLNKHGIQKFFI